MSYSLNVEKMQKIITERNNAKITKKDGTNYCIVGAKQNVIKGCKYYQMDESTKHYSTNDFYKIQAHLKKADEDGYKQVIATEEYDGKRIDRITNKYQVKNLVNGEVEDREFTIYIDNIDAFKSEMNDRLILQAYCKNGYIKKWITEDSFLTANGHKWIIIDGIPQREEVCK